MPAFKVDSTDGVEWPNVNDPGAWEIVVDNDSLFFLLDPDPQLDEEASVDLESDGWILTVASQVIDEVPDRYQDNDNGIVYLGRAEFIDSMERRQATLPFRASMVNGMLTYANEERKKLMDRVTRNAVGKARGGRTPRR